MKQLYPQIDINDLIADDFVGEDLIEKGKALPVGSVRTWSGKDYVKHADGWVAVHSGKLTSGKDMKEVEGHHNADDHSNHVKAHASKKPESQPKKPDEEPNEKQLKKLKSAANRSINHSDDTPDDASKEGKANEKIKAYNEYADKYNANLDKKVLDQEIVALKEYQGGMMNSAIGGYANIQSYLRTGKPKFGQYDERETKLANTVSDLVSSAIKKHPLDKEMTVYRGMKIKNDEPETLQYKDLKVGDTVSDKGFTSTTTSKSVASKFSEKLNRSDIQVSIEINLKPGDNALPMDKYSKGSEKEILLDKGVKFKVISVKEVGGVKKISLEIDDGKSKGNIKHINDTVNIMNDL